MAHGDLYIELQAGSSDRASVCLRAGQPIEPLSLGTSGFWRIMAAGVSPVHAFVFFDGDSVFVASGDPNNPAVAAGALVGPEWTELLPPCEIRLGHAMLLLRSAGEPVGYGAERPADMDFGDNEYSTSRVDGRELAAEHRRRKPDISFARDDEEPTRMAEPSQPVAPIAQRKSRRKPRIKVPSVEEATRFNPINEAPGNERPEAPTVPQFPVVQQPSPMTAPYQVQQGMMQQPPMLGFVPPGVGGAQPMGGPQPMTHAMAPTQPGPFPAVGPHLAQQHNGPGMMPMQPGAAGMQGAQAPIYNPNAATTPGTASKHGPLDRAKDMWKQASVPQKAILCLLPVAFVAVLVMFGDEESEASAPKPRPQPSAVVSASSSAPEPVPTASAAPPPEDTAAPVPTPEPVAAVDKPAPQPGSDKGPSPTTGKGAPPRSLERQAADAVAAGSHAEAVKLYEQLAAQNPESPVYKEAVRILRLKMADHR
jgi:hypothetical protein